MTPVSRLYIMEKIYFNTSTRPIVESMRLSVESMRPSVEPQPPHILKERRTKESAVLKVCSLLFGKDTLAPAGSLVAVVDPIIISLSVSILVTVVVTLLTKKKADLAHADACMAKNVARAK